VAQRGRGEKAFLICMFCVFPIVRTPPPEMRHGLFSPHVPQVYSVQVITERCRSRFGVLSHLCGVRFLPSFHRPPPLFSPPPPGGGRDPVRRIGAPGPPGAHRPPQPSRAATAWRSSPGPGLEARGQTPTDCPSLLPSPLLLKRPPPSSPVPGEAFTSSVVSKERGGIPLSFHEGRGPIPPSPPHLSASHQRLIGPHPGGGGVSPYAGECFHQIKRL